MKKISRLDRRFLIEEKDPYTQDDLGGYSGDWIPFYSEEDTAESGTSSTNIKMTAHGLSSGDYVINSSRDNAVREVTVVDEDNITVSSVSDQDSGDTIVKRSASKSTIWGNLKARRSSGLGYASKDSHIEDVQKYDITCRYREDLLTSKYRVRLYPDLVRSFEMISFSEDGYQRYITFSLREALP